MDRMQPPPNYYGTPYPPTDQNNQQYQQPFMGQQMNSPIPPPNGQRVEKPSKQQEEYEQMMDESTSNNSVYFAQTVNDYRKKIVSVYCTFPDSSKNRDMVFRGRLISAASDHVVIEDRELGTLYIILGVYINFIEINA